MSLHVHLNIIHLNKLYFQKSLKNLLFIELIELKNIVCLTYLPIQLQNPVSIIASIIHRKLSSVLNSEEFQQLFTLNYFFPLYKQNLFHLENNFM